VLEDHLVQRGVARELLPRLLRDQTAELGGLVRRDTSAASAMSPTDGVIPVCSSSEAAATIAARVRRRCRNRPVPLSSTVVMTLPS
jgi:hypothetical protein